MPPKEEKGNIPPFPHKRRKTEKEVNWEGASVRRGEVDVINNPLLRKRYC